MESKFKDENRGRMLGDIQNMIKSYKFERSASKSQALFSTTNNG